MREDDNSSKKNYNQPTLQLLNLRPFQTVRLAIVTIMPPEVHRELAIKAAEENISINQLILSKIIKNWFSRRLCARKCLGFIDNKLSICGL